MDTGAPGPSALASAGRVTTPVRVVERARVAVAVAFGTNGLAFATFVARVPAARNALGLSASGLGLLLLAGSAGALTALPSSGPLVQRVGPARAVLAGSLLLATGMTTLAAGIAAAAVPVAAIGLFVLGLGMSTWDVGMNVAGADVERRLGRPLLPRLHAAFSLGTVTGAGVGAAAAAGGVALPVQLTATSALVVLAIVAATRRFLPPPEGRATGEGKASGAWRAWQEPRTLLVGLMVLAFAFTEGTANDWLAVALVDGHRVSETVAAQGFGLFVAAMTVARLVGGTAIQRWGRVPVLRATAALALAGVLLVVFGPTLWWAAAGALLWGMGASLGFPVGMSAAADEPDRAAVRVSVVSSIGYTAFLAGPPLVGYLGEAMGVLRALLAVSAALVLGLVAARATRPIEQSGEVAR